ncbi:hypothetical protein [Novosphingobium sp. KN65.2]|uniref:hypothetical protein n=1 Tax=Novosphingobium sp. KN65.2 TaxID=1478134 RepID=UPI0005E3335B|nr:hypothetical protein [Novosphingobium sp. KN65.2]CDO34061.1 hypothetical protein SPHV1_100095 [Novosphingobium sp. KN65.2]
MSDAADDWLANAPGRWPFEDMLAWCENNNSLPVSREMERWYYVDTVDLPTGRTNEIKVLEGVDAAAARKLTRGELGDFAGWPEERMKGYRSWLRSCIRRGVTNARYAQMTQGGLL